MSMLLEIPPPVTGSDALEHALTRGPRFVPPVATRHLRVLIVDGQDVARCGLRLILSSQAWVGECSSTGSVDVAEEHCVQRRPDVVLITGQPDLEVTRTACRRLLDRSPTSRIVLVTSHARVSPSTLHALGAVAQVSLGSAADDILQTVRMTGLGMPVAQEAEESLLSTRQQEVLEHLASGATYSEIARALFLSSHTVKQHTCAIYRKLQVRNRAEAMRRAQSLGLLA